MDYALDIFLHQVSNIGVNMGIGDHGITADSINNSQGIMEINYSLLFLDLDEVGFEPVVVSDSDEESEILFGY